jgi:hypothetical protein
VEEMANSLLADRDALPVGKRWAHNFVKRQPELKTRLFRKYDYQRAKCEDPFIIRGWFRLVQNTIAKYGIRSDQGWEPLNVLQYIEWIDDQRQFNSINIEI